MKANQRQNGLVGWLLRWIWRCYPAGYRRRFLSEMERDLCRIGPSGKPPGGRALLDAILTLPRAWGAAVPRSVLRPGGIPEGVRQRVRSLRHSPQYAATVVLLLALAVGANTGVFSITYAALLRSLPYEAPERLVSIFPAPVVRDEVAGWRVEPEFEAMVDGSGLYIAGGGATLVRSSGTERVSLAQVTPSFFVTLGARPLLGPGLTLRTEDTRVAVLTHRLWARAFGSDPKVIGQDIDLNGEAYRVIGVMPLGVVFPAETELWVPFPPQSGFFGGPFGPKALGRLPPGTTVEALTGILEARMIETASRVPEERRRTPPPTEIHSLRNELTGSLRAPLYALTGISGLVLLLGCFNLGGAAVARTAGRTEELAVRRALGAGRRRLFVQLLTEILCLSVVAGLASLLAAFWMSTTVLSMLPVGVPGLEEVGLGGSALLFAGGLTTAAGILVGVFPALQGAMVGTAGARGARSTQSNAQTRLQNGFLVAQVAIAMILVMSAALLAGSLAKLRAVPLGYDMRNVLTFTVRLPEISYPDQDVQKAYLADLTQRLKGLPGVLSVGATSRLPLREDQGWGDYGIRTETMQEGEATTAHWIFANKEYLDAMGISVLEGHPFERSTPVAQPWDRVVLNESLARRLFGDASAVGKTVQMGFYQGWMDGVVEAVIDDVFLRGPEGPAPAFFISDLSSISAPWLGIALRTAGDPLSVIEAARATVLGVDPSVPGYRFATTRFAADGHLAARRAVAVLGGVFSVFALLVFSVGLAGLVSHTVLRRRQELGVRVALGAQSGELTRVAVLRPLGSVGLGLVLGLGAALASGGILDSLLFGLEPQDPRIVAGAGLLVALVAAIAAWVPARRIGKLDPAETLRPD